MKMKKTIVFSFYLLFTAALLSANGMLSIDAGGLFTHFNNRTRSGNTVYHKRDNMGGINVAVEYEIAKNIGVYGLANFAFGKYRWNVSDFSNTAHYSHQSTRATTDVTYAIDSQFGAFYRFNLSPAVNILLGGGFAIGGNGLSYRTGPVQYSEHATNIGAGLNVDISYRLNKLISLYGGLTDSLYAPVHVVQKKKVDDKETSETINNKGISNSFNVKLGLRFSL